MHESHLNERKSYYIYWQSLIKYFIIMSENLKDKKLVEFCISMRQWSIA